MTSSSAIRMRISAPGCHLTQSISDACELGVETFHQTGGTIELRETTPRLDLGAHGGQRTGTDVGACASERMGGTFEGTGVTLVHYPGELAPPLCGLGEVLLDDFAEHCPLSVVEAAKKLYLGLVKGLGGSVVRRRRGPVDAGISRWGLSRRRRHDPSFEHFL